VKPSLSIPIYHINLLYLFLYGILISIALVHLYESKSSHNSFIFVQVQSQVTIIHLVWVQVKSFALFETKWSPKSFVFLESKFSHNHSFLFDSKSYHKHSFLFESKSSHSLCLCSSQVTSHSFLFESNLSHNLVMYFVWVQLKSQSFISFEAKSSHKSFFLFESKSSHKSFILFESKSSHKSGNLINKSCHTKIELLKWPAQVQVTWHQSKSRDSSLQLC
jgi:hypothetical protein